MWKVLLAFVTHRLLLLFVILFTINSSTSTAPSDKFIKPIQPTSVLFKKFLSKVSEGAESATLDQLNQRPMGEVFKLTRNPFLWVNRWAVGILHIPSILSLIFFSNLFLILFLWQLYVLVERLAIPEVGTGAAVLLVLWVTSYELSLGATLSLSCFLMMAAIRHAIDNQWLLSGLALGFLALVEPLSAALIPVLVFVFWYFQRHFQLTQVLKRLGFFLIPVSCAIYYCWPEYANIQGTIDSSALFNIIHAAQSGGKWSWALSQSFLGQTVSIVFFFIGAVCAAFMNTSILYRIIPLYVLTVVLLFTPFGMVASRLCLAGVCLGGISAISSGIMNRLLQIILIALGAIEVVSVFS